MTFVPAEDLPALTALLQRGQAEIESEIRGTSMVPTLQTGDRIRIVCGDVPGIGEGDVLAFFHKGGLVAHRVVARGRSDAARDFFVTRGDGLGLCDPPVPLANVVGRVAGWRRSDGEPWRELPASPRVGFARRAGGRVAAALLELHPGLARVTAARLLWFRGKLLRLRRAQA